MTDDETTIPAAVPVEPAPVTPAANPRPRPDPGLYGTKSTPGGDIETR